MIKQIVEEFAKQEYESYILIDFAKKDKTVEEYFYTHYSIEKHRNDTEIDFIISNNSKRLKCPIKCEAIY